LTHSIIIDHYAPTYAQVALGLTSSCLLYVCFHFTSSKDISAWKQEYGVIFYMVDITDQQIIWLVIMMTSYAAIPSKMKLSGTT